MTGEMMRSIIKRFGRIMLIDEGHDGPFKLIFLTFYIYKDICLGTKLNGPY